MIKTICLLSVACAVATTIRAADPPPPTTLLARPGKLLIQDDLSKQPEKGVWRLGPGDWSIVDGCLQGAEREKDHHPAVLRRPLAFSNAIVRYEFRFEGAKASSFSVNDAKEHVCRVMLTPRLFRVQKDDHDHAGPDKAVVLGTKPLGIAPDAWHTLVVELYGPEMVVTLDGEHTLFGSDELIATEKANFGFTVAGDHMRFRNLCVWEAEAHPDWQATKSELSKRRSGAATTAP
jgi:hypothetical protein